MCQNPCSNVSVTGLAAPQDRAQQAQQARKRLQVDGRSRYNVLNELSRHRQREIDGTAASSPATTLSGRDAEDVGDIAVILDEGDIVAPPNTFDLRIAGASRRNGSGGYDARRIDPIFRQTLGTAVGHSADDAAAAAPLAIQFQVLRTVPH